MARIRLASEDDAAHIQAIYAPIVRDTIISFETVVPTVDEMRARIRSTLERQPWLVLTQGDALLGYAYASQHRARIGYQWSVDVSAYVHPEARRIGVARALYTSLLNILIIQGFFNAYAGIALPNPASVGLHEALGFQPVGVYHGVGYKLGAWHDVGWWHLRLCPLMDAPAAPLLLSEARYSSGWQTVLESGLALLRGD